MNKHDVIVGLVQLFMGCSVLALILTGLYYFTRKWENNNPVCDRCQTRGVGIETIELVGQSTGFKVCQECSQDDTIRYSEDARWVLVLRKLYQMSQSIKDYNYDITTATWWPKDKKTKKPLAMDEIVDAVLYEGTDLP